MIDGQNFFDQSMRNNLITFDNIRKIGQGDDYTTDCLLGYSYFKTKQQALDADPKAIQQINVTENLKQQATIYFIIEEAKETISDFSQGTVRIF